MSRVAIVGSREGIDERVVRDHVRKLVPGTVVVSGAARGVDSWAAQEARQRGLEVVEYLPDYDAHGRGAPLVRNKTIARDCDAMVVFWNGRSRGCMHAASEARKLGKLVEVIRP